MLYDGNIYISIARFCELKNISKATFYNRKKKKLIPYKLAKRPGQGKKLFVVIKEEDVLTWDKVFLDSNNKLCLLEKN